MGAVMNPNIADDEYHQPRVAIDKAP